MRDTSAGNGILLKNGSVPPGKDKERERTSDTKGKLPKDTTGTKMTMSTTSIMTPRIHRKVLRAPSKLHPGKMHHLHYSGKLRHPGKGSHYSGKATSYSGKSSSLGKPMNGMMHSSKLISHSERSMGKMGHHQGKGYHINGDRSCRGKGITTTFHHPESVCDNSNDSGLGFDHLELHSNNLLRSTNQSDSSSWNVTVGNGDIKRCKTDIKFDSDDAIDNFPFPGMETDNATTLTQLPIRLNVSEKPPLTNGPRNGRRTISSAVQLPLTPPTLSTPLLPHSRDGRVNLQILCQPEQQHRARYQTEGSRGAVKDRSGNSFPIVKLVGYSKPTVLQVFIGTDIGRVAPHMFYQACRVSGKNSTPCSENKVDGTVLIEIELNSQKDWQVTCDCVGILKERNVDVEHRFGEQSGQRLKKKSTRCRMVFRTQIVNDDGSVETIQVSSQQIVCTQPPGIPEICKKSLVSCPANGGLELFLLGKNFLKDTRVVFQAYDDSSSASTTVPSRLWEEQVLPDKEYLQQNHLICGVPPFVNSNITEAVSVKLFVVSAGKSSEPHTFMFTPVSQSTGSQHASSYCSPHCSSDGHISLRNVFQSVACGLLTGRNNDPKDEKAQCGTEAGMMPPPAPPTRRPSLLPPLSPTSPPLSHFKTECSDESSQSSIVDSDASDMMAYRMNPFKVHNENSSDLNENSMDQMHPVMRQLSNESVSQYNNCANMSIDTTVDVLRMSESGNSMNMMMHRENTRNTEDSSITSYTQSSLMISQMIPTPPLMIPTTNSVSSDMLSIPRQMSPEDIKVMDLRMKPSGIVAAADQTQMASFKQFVETHTKMQSTSVVPTVDSFLSSIDTKTVLPQNMEKASPLETFSKQMEALQKQNTDKVMESVAAAIFQSSAETGGVGGMYSQGDSAMKQMLNVARPLARDPTCIANQSPIPLQDSMGHETGMTNSIMSNAQNKPIIEFSNNTLMNNQTNQIEPLVSAPQMTLSPEIILNPQVSPTLLCSQEGTLPAPQLLSSSLPQDDIVMLTNNQNTTTDSMSLMNSLSPTVKTPPSAVKNMILNAAAEIFTSDSTVNALVTSAINTANILTNENVQNQSIICNQTSPIPVNDIHPQQGQQQNMNGDFNFTQSTMMEKESVVTESAVINHAVTQAVSQAVSHAVSQAVSHAVNQEMKTSTSAPMQDIISMSDNDLLSYINPMLF